MNENFNIKDYNQINVLEKALDIDPNFDITGKKDVSDVIQQIINKKGFCSFYFPRGTYLFEKGISTEGEIVLEGEANLRVETALSDQPISNATNFITHTKEDMSIIHIGMRKVCIKNINFYSDSFKMKKNDRIPTNGNPGYHYEKVNLGVPIGNVNAITHYVDLEHYGGLGHFENLYFYGFSGIGFEIPYYSIVNNIAASNCNTGFDAATDCIITDSCVSDCVTGIEISTGTELNTIRIERMQKFGIVSRKGKGWGSNKLSNITIDECGYAGIYLYQIFNSSISAIMTRCGQYFYQTDYDTFLYLIEKYMDPIDKAEKSSAYSMIYGDMIVDSSIEILGMNVVSWEDHVSDTIQKLAVFNCNYILRSTAKSTIETFDNIYSVRNEGSLRYTNQYGSSLFKKLNKPYECEGLNTSYKMDERLIRAQGTMLKLRDVDKEVDPYYTAAALVVASSKDDIEHIIRRYGTGRADNLSWTSIGSGRLGSDNIYYFKSISKI